MVINLVKTPAVLLTRFITVAFVFLKVWFFLDFIPFGGVIFCSGGRWWFVSFPFPSWYYSVWRKIRFFNFWEFVKEFCFDCEFYYFFIDDFKSVLNSSFTFMVCFKNNCLRRLLKYLHLYIIWKDVSRQFVSQLGSHSFITSVQ